jgi:hypothetical protein
MVVSVIYFSLFQVSVRRGTTPVFRPGIRVALVRVESSTTQKIIRRNEQ